MHCAFQGSFYWLSIVFVPALPDLLTCGAFYSEQVSPSFHACVTLCPFSHPLPLNNNISTELCATSPSHTRKNSSSVICLAAASAGAEDIPHLGIDGHGYTETSINFCYVFCSSHFTPLLPAIPTSLNGFSQFVKTSDRVTYCLGAVPLTQ